MCVCSAAFFLGGHRLQVAPQTRDIHCSQNRTAESALQQCYKTTYQVSQERLTLLGVLCGVCVSAPVLSLSLSVALLAVLSFSEALLNPSEGRMKPPTTTASIVL